MTPFKRIFRNFSLLVFGRIGTALLNLGAVMLTARALPLAEFGSVAIIHVYIQTVRGLVNAQPYLAVIKYGVQPLDRSDRGELEQLFGFSRSIDRVSAVLATFIALGLSPVVAAHFHWDAATRSAAMLFSAVLLLSGTGTSIGILRLFDRFDHIAMQLSVGPAIRCCGAAIGWLAGFSLNEFFILWAFSFAADFSVLKIMGYRERRARGLQITAPRHGTTFPGIYPFLGSVWVQFVLSLIPYRFATLFVGFSLGSVFAGLFRACSEIASVVIKPAELLQQAVFPDLTRLVHSEPPVFRRVVIRIALAALGFGLAFMLVAWLFGAAILALLFGSEFSQAADLLTLLMFAAALELGTAVLRPAAYALDLEHTVTWLNIGAVVVLVALFFALIKPLGLVGLGVAIATSWALLWSGIFIIILRHSGAAVRAAA